jgi:hypothetical protein
VGLGRGCTHAQDAVLADQLDEAVADAALGVALGVGLDVAQVADVAVVVGWGAVLLAMGVVCHALSVLFFRSHDIYFLDDQQ